MIKFIDLFAGIGGFRLGFEGIGAKCVFTCEIDKYARQTYEHNFDCHDHAVSHDIREVSAEAAAIKPFDVLLAGFPCQPFSVGGVIKNNSIGNPTGKDHKSGRMFDEIVRILKSRMPYAFVLENVPGLKSMGKGAVLDGMLTELGNLGYHVQFKIINSEHWLPQKRKRLFIIGFQHEPDGFSMDDIIIPSGKRHVIGDILERCVEAKHTLSDQRWGNILKRSKQKHWSSYKVSGPDDVAATIPARYYGECRHNLFEQSGKNPRKFTPRECARLMGFPDTYGIVCSDSQAYKQFGNAVCPPVVESIAMVMKPYLEEGMYD